MKVLYDYNASNYQSFIEPVGLQNIEQLQHKFGLEYRSAWEQWCNIHVGLNWTYMQFKNLQSQKMNQGQGFFNINFSAWRGLRSSLKNELYFLHNASSAIKNKYVFSDLILNYNLKKYKMSFEVTAKNIFNVDNYKNATLTESYSSVVSYRLLPRQLMLGIRYNF